MVSSIQSGAPGGCRRIPAGFTLVELLVVIAVIVILLALLAPALDKALKASENAKCAANQKNITGSVIGYGMNNNNFLPPSSTQPLGSSQLNFAYAMDYNSSQRVRQGPTNVEADPSDGIRLADGGAGRGFLGLPLTFLAVGIEGRLFATGGQVAPQESDATTQRDALGLGILVRAALLPSTKLGEVAHCPRLDTSSATPSPKFGMDEVYKAKAGDDSESQAAGGSYWVDPAHVKSRIIGSYNYRGASYAFTRRGNDMIHYVKLPTSYVLLADLPERRYGRNFHHKTGYNVATADGHVHFYDDPKGRIDAFLEGRATDQQNDFSMPDPANPGKRIAVQSTADTFIDGKTRPQVDEVVYEVLSKPPRS